MFCVSRYVMWGCFDAKSVFICPLDSDYNPSYDVLMPDAMPPGARPKESDAHAEMKALWLVARRALLLIVAEFDRHFGIDGKADKLSHPN